MDDVADNEESRITKIKQHLKDHRKTYLVGAGCLGAGYILRGAAPVVTAAAKNTAFMQWKPNANIIQETIIQMPARGHRGNVLWCNELDMAFPSQNAAAKALGLQASNLSSHLSGKNPHCGGFTFQSLGENLRDELTVAA